MLSGCSKSLRTRSAGAPLLAEAIAASTISLIAESHSGCCAASLYLIIRSLSLDDAVPSKSTYCP